MPHRLLHALFALALSACCHFAWGQGRIEIESFAWTDGIDRATRQYANKYDPPIKGRQAYLWMRVKGTPELLTELRQAKRDALPIRHEWYFLGADAFENELNVKVDLNIGAKKDFEALEREAQAQGYFRWRVWSGKERLYPGYWEVHIKYESGDAVVCPKAGDANAPCKFRLKVL